MIQVLAWPFVALVIGGGLVLVLRRYLGIHIEAHEDIEEVLAELHDIFEAHGKEIEGLHGQAPRLQALEDEVRNLGQRVPATRLAR